MLHGRRLLLATTGSFQAGNMHAGQRERRQETSKTTPATTGRSSSAVESRQLRAASMLATAWPGRTGAAELIAIRQHLQEKRAFGSERFPAIAERTPRHPVSGTDLDGHDPRQRCAADRITELVAGAFSYLRA